VALDFLSNKLIDLLSPMIYEPLATNDLYIGTYQPTARSRFSSGGLGSGGSGLRALMGESAVAALWPPDIA
jgi:hypothetical protein